MQSSFFSSGLALASISLVLVGGGALIWSNRQPDKTGHLSDQQTSQSAAPAKMIRVLPPPLPPADVANAPQLHGVTYAIENGTAIVKIRVIPDGDELIVDASTGRLIESRPSRPSAPPPMGKFAAPFVPMM